MLQPRGRQLDGDAVLPFRVDRLLPGLRRLLGRDDIGVIGEPGRSDRAPGPIAFRVAFVFRLVELHLRRDVMDVAALFLEVEDHPHVGDLHHIDRIGPRLALGADLGVKRAGLQPGVVGLDLREELRELGEDAQFGGLGIGGVDDDFALGLGLLDIGAGLEAVYLPRLGAAIALRRQRRPPRSARPAPSPPATPSSSSPS